MYTRISNKRGWEAKTVGLACMVCMILAMAQTARAGTINLEWRPAEQTVELGEIAEIGLYAVSDDPQETQYFSAVKVVLEWMTDYLRPLDVDNTGAVPLLFSGFPFGDPHNLNEAVPPVDGDGLYQGLAFLGAPAAATPAGTLLTTIRFDTLGLVAGTLVEMPPLAATRWAIRRSSTGTSPAWTCWAPSWTGRSRSFPSRPRWPCWAWVRCACAAAGRGSRDGTSALSHLKCDGFVRSEPRP